MANAEWPYALPHQSLRSGLKPTPPKLRARTDFDDGTARTRRRFRTAPWQMAHRWVWTLEQYELFKSFWSVTLAEGAAWFDMPVFTGAGYAVCACRFVEEPQATLKGVSWTVDATLEVNGFTVLTKAEANDRWPGSIT